ncbi:MAG: hypothetical protein JSW39_16880 [Desulfobacterales bacterium]|nr:MAG: hypothetical protein JSW39_16880 [Desulfobacterales bacterium]
MKEKYLLIKDDKNKELTIKEFAEIDKDIFALLCAETYSAQEIESAIGNSRPGLTSVIRTKNFYPPGLVADKIAESVAQLYASGTEESLEVLFDDKEFFIQSQEEFEAVEDIEGDLDEAEDELDGLLDDGPEIKSQDDRIQLEEEESLDTENDS